jgi:hypothetical protein
MPRERPSTATAQGHSARLGGFVASRMGTHAASLSHLEQLLGELLLVLRGNSADCRWAGRDGGSRSSIVIQLLHCCLIVCLRGVAGEVNGAHTKATPTLKRNRPAARLQWWNVGAVGVRAASAECRSVPLSSKGGREAPQMQPRTRLAFFACSPYTLTRLRLAWVWRTSCSTRAAVPKECSRSKSKWSPCSSLLGAARGTMLATLPPLPERRYGTAATSTWPPC